MKKQLFSGFLLATALFVSCNNDGDNSTSGTDSGSMSNTTTGDGNLQTDTASTSTTGTTATGATANNVNETDKTFMMESAGSGMMEVQAGQLAAQNASSDRVKAFGNMMVQDHTNANNELKALASQKNVMLPDSLPAKHREHLNTLKTKTGREFDRTYMSMMVTHHNEDVNKFQVASNNAGDADVKGFATKNLPILRGHLDSAKAINTAVKR